MTFILKYFTLPPLGIVFHRFFLFLLCTNAKGCCSLRECWALVNRFNHTSRVALVTSTYRPKSVRNRCAIEVFGDVFCVVALLFGFFFSVGVGAFVIGLSQISCFFYCRCPTHPSCSRSEVWELERQFTSGILRWRHSMAIQKDHGNATDLWTAHVRHAYQIWRTPSRKTRILEPRLWQRRKNIHIHFWR